MLARRAGQIDSSGIRKVFDLAQKLENPVNLSIGQPHFDVPAELKEEAKKWIDAGFSKYTVTQGTQGLREKLREKYQEEGIEFDEIMITSGVSGGLVLAAMVLFEEGDEVLIPDPYFVMYKHLVRLMGATPVYVDTYPDFRLRVEQLEGLVNRRTKALVLNSPCNPTGISLTEEEQKEIAEFAGRNKLLILFDEIYERFNYDHPHANIARFHPQTLILHGFSKSHAMTGWRLGFAAGPMEIVSEMIKIQQFSFVCAPSIAQKMGLAALDLPPGKEIEDYRRKRDIVYEGLKGKFHIVKPNGAFYFFPEAPGGDGDEFVRNAIEHNVLIIPGSVFSEKNTHFRLSFAAEDEVLREGVEILNSIA
ncbi:aminotransferase class I/II-fold pyridoxal phosphate-dependent enzyme [bacterium]|nr:aminotransferase class I/II-fold pyridoxal phosphate-dependent enzyme [bacterium]